jgi:hypothetical protein
MTNHSQSLRTASHYFLFSSELRATVSRVPTQMLYPRREECMDVAQFSSVSPISHRTGLKPTLKYSQILEVNLSDTIDLSQLLMPRWTSRCDKARGIPIQVPRVLHKQIRIFNQLSQNLSLGHQRPSMSASLQTGGGGSL